MKFLVGTDMERVSRFKSFAADEKKLRRIFSEYEAAYALKKPRPEETLAGFFCAKEAVSKAAGTGVASLLKNEIEVRHDVGGRPFILLHGDLAERFSGWTADVSITHCGGLASATVVLYGGGL